MAGRPKIEINWDNVQKLALLQCTQEEIASFVGVSVDTLQKRKEFIGIYKKARDEGKMSLRRMMWKKANEGNTTMLIWLSKQYLGFTDKQEITGKDGQPLESKPVFIVADKETRNLTEQLLKPGAN